MIEGGAKKFQGAAVPLLLVPML